MMPHKLCEEIVFVPDKNEIKIVEYNKKNWFQLNFTHMRADQTQKKKLQIEKK